MSEIIEPKKEGSREEIVERLKGPLNKIYENHYDKMVSFAGVLKNKYPDSYQSYRLYHFMIGSTPREECPNFDFPGDYSIQKFIERAGEE